MHIQVAYVNAPYLMPTLSPERHICLGARPAWHLEMIQASIDGKIATTGSTRKLDAHLLKRCAAPMAMMKAAVPVMAGQRQVTANVTAVFEIAPK